MAANAPPKSQDSENPTASPSELFVPASCRGEHCWCGAPASHKVEETIFFDDPISWINTNAWIEVPSVGRVLARHPLTSYICHEHFVQIMGPMAEEIAARQAAAKSRGKK